MPNMSRAEIVELLKDAKSLYKSDYIGRHISPEKAAHLDRYDQAIAALEEQEPVAWADKEGRIVTPGHRVAMLRHEQEATRELAKEYDRPLIESLPAQAARVPDKRRVTDLNNSLHKAYVFGFNDCRDEMRNAASAPAEKQTRSRLPENVTRVRNAATGESVRVEGTVCIHCRANHAGACATQGGLDDD